MTAHHTALRQRLDALAMREGIITPGRTVRMRCYGCQAMRADICGRCGAYAAYSLTGEATPATNGRHIAFRLDHQAEQTLIMVPEHQYERILRDAMPVDKLLPDSDEGVVFVAIGIVELNGLWAGANSMARIDARDE